MLSSATKAAANVTKSLAENDLRNAVRDAKGNGQDGLQNVSDYALDAGQKVRSFVDKAVDRTRDASDKLTTEIKSEPIRSSAIALGAGFVLGALLARR
ncbi:DUF883 C-terminal domain-containing protein [Asticcacaulis sp. AC402]|uniref:DUF883 C-terminal domain-containing protein n=1 Tax=Asticcacaulis sp. AC402 TaxID=1282361 RepID=UPI0003C3B8A4|nr:DUF883 C-terminal domain-containing protein [Asticcacaulis sp. AC402]ESQ77728.1 hypothetical protein ABAC402_00940 [Asticcacaulis sp. AC402]